MLLDEVNWAYITKRTEPTRKNKINLNELEDRLAHLIFGHDRLVLDLFNFHTMEKALNTASLPAVSFSNHVLL